MLDIISSGYKIPFIEEPPCAKFENSKSAADNSEFLNETLAGLVETGCTLEVLFLPEVISPLSVSTKNNKKRLILDLRYVDKFIWKEKIKFDDWSVFQNYICPKGYMFKFDLCSGYHHIDIFPALQLFLGFSWKVESATKYFCFTVLPFGISPCPYAFTKVCRILVKLWRSNGVKIAMFIDDGNGIAGDRATADIHSDLVRKSLRRSGFVASSSKSIWEPCLELEWLGIIVNTNEGFLKLPFHRLESLDNALDSFFSTFPSISAWRLSRISGIIISMSPVMDHISQIMSRNILRVIAQQISWDSDVDVSSDLKLLAEIRFWQ